MRIRVRVTAPVEKLRQARRTSRFPIRTGAQPELALERLGLEREIGSRHRDGVVHRLSGGANRRAPPQPMNNAGQAIQVSRPAGFTQVPTPGRLGSRRSDTDHITRQRVRLVDNVTTSGHTLQAAHDALGFGTGLVFADAAPRSTQLQATLF